MNKTDLFGSFNIHDGSDKYILSANFDFDRSKYYMPALQFLEIKSVIYPEQNLYWDSDVFLFGELIEILQAYLDKTMKDSQKEYISEIYEQLNDEEVTILLEMLNKGKELNWDKL